MTANATLSAIFVAALAPTVRGQVATTDLAGLVFADIDSNNKLRFQVSQGFNALLAVIGENGSQLGIGRSESFGPTANMNRQPILD